MLTSLLRANPDLAERLRNLALMEVRSTPTDFQILARPLTDHYALIGTATDYLERWEIERRNPLAKDQEWIASLALKMPQLQDADRSIQETFHRIVSIAKMVHDQFVEADDPGEELTNAAVESCLKLAKIDPLFRTGTVDPTVDVVHPHDIVDVWRVYRIADWDVLGGAIGSKPRLNPSFGKVSTIFNGADADLIVDTTLIDFKCVKGTDLSKYVPQLIGYTMCADRYRATEAPDFPSLTHAGIYFARHGKLATFPLELVRMHPDWADAEQAFFQTAMDQFGTGPKSTELPNIEDPEFNFL